MLDIEKLNAWVKASGWTKKELCDAIGISVPTWYRKTTWHESEFTRKEINQMIDLLGCVDPMSIFFAPEVAETQVKEVE